MINSKVYNFASLTSAVCVRSRFIQQLTQWDKEVRLCKTLSIKDSYIRKVRPETSSK